MAQALGEQPRRLRVGIGDDAAAWKARRSHLSLISTDALVDGVHFIGAATSPSALGHKALAVNLSDIAAMGGAAILAVVALGITDVVDEAWTRSFYHGLSSLGRRFGCAVAGGDVVRAPALLVAVSVVGEVRKSGLRLRRGARAGDLVCVSGPVGLAAGGLNLARAAQREANIPSDDVQVLRRAYEMPWPRLPEGKFLGRSRACHAMMDISDGLSMDAARMARASEVDVCLERHALWRNRPDALRHFKDAEELMISGGDDYELLAAVDPRAYPHVAHRFAVRFRRTLWMAGRFEEGSGKCWIEDDDGRKQAAPSGWDHLRR